MQVKVAQVEKIETMLPSMLVSATYDGPNKSAILKFYEQTQQKLLKVVDCLIEFKKK